MPKYPHHRSSAQVFAGLYMLHRLRGLGLSTRVYEAGSGVGGTWFWNRYQGESWQVAQCCE